MTNEIKKIMTEQKEKKLMFYNFFLYFVLTQNKKYCIL